MDEPNDVVTDLPLLGEAFAVEFANTRYEAPGEDLDFMADLQVMTTWFRHAPTAEDITVPEELPHSARKHVQRLRDSVRRLLCERAHGACLSTEAARLLNESTRVAPAHLLLDVTGDEPAWEIVYAGGDTQTFIASVAARCVLFLGGEDAARVRRCARPVCPMLFVQHHRRRRFCHESCAHSERQARYYRAAKKSGQS